MNSRTECIYIVDDDEEDNYLLIQSLRSEKLDSITFFFSNINELLDYSKNYDSPSVILINPFLHSAVVREEIVKLKNEPNFRSAPIFLLIASKVEKDYFQSKGLEVEGYLVKPIRAKILKRFLRKRKLKKLWSNGERK